MGQLLRRTWVLAIAATLLAGLFGASTASAAAKKKPASVRITLLDAVQANVLKTRAVRVRVRSAKAGVVRVSLTAGKKPVVARNIRFRKAGTKLVKLPLSAAGRKSMGSCLKRNLTVRARRGASRAFVISTYQRDPGRCTTATGATIFDEGPKLVASSSGSGVSFSGGSTTGSGGSGGSGGGSNGGGSNGGSNGGGTTTTPRPKAELPGGYGTTANPSDRCDPIDGNESVCLYPFPNNHFTASADKNVFSTGLRLNIDRLSTPRNRANKPIDPMDQNRNDGFSPGNAITTFVPGLTNSAAFTATGAVPITDMARYADTAAPIVVIDTELNERWPVWSEIDSNPDNENDRSLIIRPAVNFAEGHRYVVALRRMKDKDGKIIKPTDAFRFFRDNLQPEPGIPAFEARRPKMEKIFADLARAGIAREDLYLAWDFTVASAKNLSERALSIRDDAFARLGDTKLDDFGFEGASPRVVINPDVPDDLAVKNPCFGQNPPDADFPIGTAVDLVGPCGDKDFKDQDGVFTITDDDRIARQVRGQVIVPCYLNQPGCPPGSRFAYSSSDATKPIIETAGANTMAANFICNIPKASLTSPGKPAIYGHGLLGGAGEVGQGQLRSLGQEGNYVFCATDWVGMSTFDVPNVATLLADLSQFSTLTDRVQQALVNFMYVGRSMLKGGMTNATTTTTSASGVSATLPSSPALPSTGTPSPGQPSVIHPFRVDMAKADSPSVIDTASPRLFYDGNSQGGIIGGALAALAVDTDRAVLGVPGMNYSTLLHRSVDFDTYAQVMYEAYPNELDRPLLFSIIQLLWDRAEANGYARHVQFDPYPNTPSHQVLMHVGFGDHQVANVSADVMARTIGAATMPNPAVGRFPDVKPLWGIERIPGFPYSSSAIVYWDSGSPVPPTTNEPPRDGADSHEHPRRDPKARAQKIPFLQKDGVVKDTCGNAPCTAAAG